MFALLSQEEVSTAVTTLKALEDFISSLKKYVPSFEEVYAEVKTKESFSGFTEDEVREIYEQK